MSTHTDKVYETWYCKIGETHRDNVPAGGDFPMRRAIERMYHDLTGEWPEFIFSGWGAELTESERAAVEVWRPHEQAANDGEDAQATRGTGS